MFGLLYCYIQEDNFGIGSKSGVHCNGVFVLKIVNVYLIIHEL
jgi:hypothetical protein